MDKPFYKRLYFKVLITGIIIIILAIMSYLKILNRFYPPKVADKSAIELERKELSEKIFICDNSWLKKNEYGLWEMYLEGGPFELGAKHGILTKELTYFQEEAFMTQVRRLVPSASYLKFLRFFIGVFNRNIALYVPEEYQKEIYGISLNASSDFNYVSRPYHRLLNYHAAHDIGHALQNMNMVYCTAFGVKNGQSSDSSMIIGRNFDLYIGDDFAVNKIVAFVKPDSGYKFCSITWASMIGVISGMNEKGLVITYNSAKSAIPLSAKIPVSILARQILQYASNIEEAYEIAKSHRTFVSGSFLIASAEDKKTVVFEKTKKDIDVFDTNDDVLILTNHYQGEKFKNRELNLENIEEGSSMYRWERTKELLGRTEKHDIFSIAEVLRDQRGLNDKDIGMGNEKAVNQLIAHHSIIFRPEELKLWVSTNPYQLGSYVSYDLNKVFSDDIDIQSDIFVREDNIPEDEFLHTQEYKDFEKYKSETTRLESIFKNKKKLEVTEDEMLKYVQLNPNYYYSLFIAGEFYRRTGNKELARKYFEDALSREIPWKSEEEKIIESLKKISK